MNEQERWLESAKKNGSAILAIVLDLEDRESFPVEFETRKDFLKYKNNIISESKLKILKIYELL